MASPSTGNREITKEQLKVYQTMFNMFIKGVLAIGAMLAFLGVIVAMIFEPNVYVKVGYGVFDALIGGTGFVVYKHYFPVKKGT